MVATHLTVKALPESGHWWKVTISRQRTFHWQNGARVKIQSRRQHVAHWLRDHLPHLYPLQRNIVYPYSLIPAASGSAAHCASLTRGPELSLLPERGAALLSPPPASLSHPRPHPTLFRVPESLSSSRSRPSRLPRRCVSRDWFLFFLFSLPLSLPTEFSTPPPPPDRPILFSRSLPYAFRPTSSRDFFKRAVQLFGKFLYFGEHVRDCASL